MLAGILGTFLDLLHVFKCTSFILNENVNTFMMVFGNFLENSVQILVTNHALLKQIFTIVQ